MISNSFIKQMENRIDSSDYGSAFIVSDFTDLMDYETAKKSLLRLEKSGKLRRVIRGVYDKPRFSELLKEYAAPNPDNVAKAIARNYNWTVSASGNTALNQLGLSTQVPANYSYVSSGPYKAYTIGNTTIEFTHRSDSQISGMSNNTRLVIQALKALGKDRVSEKEIQYLRNHFSEEDRYIILIESRNTINWIYSVIKKICAQ